MISDILDIVEIFINFFCYQNLSNDTILNRYIQFKNMFKLNMYLSGKENDSINLNNIKINLR